MTSKQVESTAVTDNNGRLQGIITDGDLRRMLSRSQDLSGWDAGTMMTRAPKTIAATALG